MTIDLFTDANIEYFIRILIATVCGGLFGLERQLKGKPFGIRTCILICVGTTVFVYLGQLNLTDRGDPNRVLGQVITGIGFLGAGAILHNHEIVSGITSAATIWFMAAVGVAIGLGHYDISIFTTVFALFILVLCQKIEKAIPQLRKGHHKHDK